MQINEISYAVIGAAIEVHRVLGPGLLESAYQKCLCHELTIRQIPFQKELELPVVYKGVQIDCSYRIDILVANMIVLELKSVDELAPIHEAQMLTYLRLGGWNLGLLINFNVEVLKKGIRRLINGTLP